MSYWKIIGQLAPPETRPVKIAKSYTVSFNTISTASAQSKAQVLSLAHKALKAMALPEPLTLPPCLLPDCNP